MIKLIPSYIQRILQRTLTDTTATFRCRSQKHDSSPRKYTIIYELIETVETINTNYRNSKIMPEAKTRIRTRRKRKPLPIDMDGIHGLFAHGKLTFETIKALCDNLSIGVPIKQAANVAGISEKTYYNWRTEGMYIWNRTQDRIDKGEKIEDIVPSLEERDQLILQFLQSVKKANAVAVAYHTQIIHKAGKKSWQASAWYLERRHPNEFGRHDYRNHPPLNNQGNHAEAVSRDVIDDESLLNAMRGFIEASKSTNTSPELVEYYEYMIAAIEGQDMSKRTKPQRVLDDERKLIRSERNRYLEEL